jgi:5-formyltetrahydrofolate cyclo-ligase
MESLAQEKANLRSVLRRKRRQQDREKLLADSQAIGIRLLQLPELQRAETVFCYVSCGGEVETHRLIETLLAGGKTVVVPRCKPEGRMDCVPIAALSDLMPGAMNIPEPRMDAPSIPAAQVDFAVVPAVACGEDGSRLGQGGGYYDRFLEKASCEFAAICQTEFLLPAIPCEAHDRKMKMIVTPQRVLRFEEV